MHQVNQWLLVPPIEAKTWICQVCAKNVVQWCDDVDYEKSGGDGDNFFGFNQSFDIADFFR